MLECDGYVFAFETSDILSEVTAKDLVEWGRLLACVVQTLYGGDGRGGV